MAQIISYKGRLPKRIGDTHVIYELDGILVVREKSGFTRKALLTSAKYANCRLNSSEFGRVSRTCKGIRLALQSLLPKHNNLGVVNSLTKHMRSLLAYDFQNVRGSRLLRNALEHSDGQRGFVGYDFNPDATFALSSTFAEGQLTLHAFDSPQDLAWIGIRVHVLAFDWEAMTGALYSGGWHFEQGMSKASTYSFPKPAVTDGSLIYLLEVQGFEEKEGAFLPIGEKSLQVVGVMGQMEHTTMSQTDDVSMSQYGDERMGEFGEELGENMGNRLSHRLIEGTSETLAPAGVLVHNKSIYNENKKR